MRIIERRKREKEKEWTEKEGGEESDNFLSRYSNFF